jgi:hypothetical protein
MLAGFVGIEATTPNQCLAMTFFHTDIWSADFTNLKLS